MQDDALYCKVFVNGGVTRDDLLQLLLRDGAHTTGRSTLSSPLMCISVRRNEDYDAGKSVGQDGFLYFQHYLDISPTKDADRAAYVLRLGLLLKHLRAHALTAVAACTFEDELP